MFVHAERRPLGEVSQESPAIATVGPAGNKHEEEHMYPGAYAEQHPDRPAFIMASTGE